MTTPTFSIRGIFKEAWQPTKQHLWLFTAVFFAFLILYFLVEVLSGGINRYIVDPNEAPMQTLLRIIQQMYSVQSILSWFILNILVSFVSLGLAGMALQVVAGREPGLPDLLIAPKKIMHCFLALIIFNVIGVIGLVLCIVPGLLLMARLQFFYFFIVEEDCNAFEALSKSWKCSKGRTWKLVLFSLAVLVLVSLSVLLFVVGVVVVVPWTIIAYALVYRKITS